MVLETVGLRAIVEGGSQYLNTVGRMEKAERDLASQTKKTAGATDSMADAVRRAKRAQEDQREVTQYLEQDYIKAEAALKKFSMFAGLAFAAAMAGSIKLAMDFENQLDQVGAIAGATEQEITSLGEEAKKIGAETAFSAGEAAAAMEELAAGGRSVAQILGGEARAAVDLAAAGNYGLADSARTIATTMDIWKGTQLETNDVVNALAAAANESRFGVDDMAAAIAQGGGAAKTAGVEFDEFATAVAATASSFASGSDAGTSFKTFVIGLTGNSEQAKDAIKDLGLVFFDAQEQLRPMSEIVQELHDKLGPLSEMQQTVYLKQIFGNDAFRTAAGLMKLTGDEFEAMSARMVNADAGAIATQRMSNLSGSVEELKGSLETIGIEIGTRFIPALARSAEKATELTNAFGELDATTQNAIVGFTGMTLAVGKFNPAAGIMVGLVGGLTLTLDALIKKLGGRGLLAQFSGPDQEKKVEELAERMSRLGADTDKVTFTMRELGLVSREMRKALDEIGTSADSVGEKILDVQLSWAVGTADQREAKDAMEEFRAEVVALAGAMVANEASVLELSMAYHSLPPELQGAFDEATNIVNVLTSIANESENTIEVVGRAGLGFETLSQQLRASGSAAEESTNPIIEWVTQVMTADESATALSDAIDVLIGQFASLNPAVASLAAENAFLNEELDDLKAKEDALSEGDAERIAAIEAEIAANDKLIASYQSNQKALEGAKAALVNYMGEGGLGTLLSVLNETGVAQEAQIDILSNVNGAYKLLSEGSITKAIDAFADLKAQLKPEEWAPIAAAIGPDLVAAIEGGIADPAQQQILIAAIESLLGISLETADASAEGETLGEETVDSVATGVDSKEDDLNSALETTLAAALDQVNVLTDAELVGQSMIDGVSAGAEKAAGTLYGKVRDIIGNALAEMRAKAETGSPSRWTKREVGEPIPEGIAAGIVAQTPMMLAVAEEMMRALLGTILHAGTVTGSMRPTAGVVSLLDTMLPTVAAAGQGQYGNAASEAAAAGLAGVMAAAASWGMTPEEMDAYIANWYATTGMTPPTSNVIHGQAAIGGMFGGQPVPEGAFDPSGAGGRGMWYWGGAWQMNPPPTGVRQADGGFAGVGGESEDMQILARMASMGNHDAAARLDAARLVNANAPALVDDYTWYQQNIGSAYNDWIGRGPLAPGTGFDSGSMSFDMKFDFSGAAFGSNPQENGEAVGEVVRKILREEAGRSAFLSGIGATLRRREV